ncbi:transcription factor Tfb2 [Durotheca rogersii]|uniref:transcription factor Tfb2 n=1 Tax=Durotheca rogersii TaxID=419775 RepID=UPI0022206646|nr:transcription factor Tfb2 [Durotheca rogersii]KAI5856703.1 transcription factor Tfb2 [Durotheca rogersii]
MSGNTKSLSQYLEQLPGTTFRKLYQQPSTAFAIFRRMLPHMAKTIVMAILYSPNPFLLSDLDVWVKPSATREKDQSIAILRSLHIIQPQSLTLTANFKNSLRLALEGGGDHNSFGVLSTHPIPSDVDHAFLDKYAKKKWDDILYYIVATVGLTGPEKGSSGPKQSVKDLLLAGRLVERRPGGGVQITQGGFSFLLQETNAQVWALLLLWLEAVDAANANGSSSGMDGVDMLSFFFLLASLEFGRAYSTDALTETRRNMLPMLVDLGLIYIPHNNPHQFFPTRLATTLTSNETALRSVSAGFSAASDATTDTQDKCTIILETNFRMYAYVTSPLQIAVLALFSDLKFRFKGLASGHLTRNSIGRAVSMGITADQIVSYLSTHADEQMYRHAAATNKPVLPPVVIDQIRLWQLDTDRAVIKDGYLFKEFDEYKEYKAVVDFADNIGVCAWRNDKKGIFFATKVEQIKDFMKSRRKANEASAGDASK